MEPHTVDRVHQDGLRTLTREDIDRRLRFVASVVTRVGDDLSGDRTRPRWISAAELVRRVRPFLSCN